MKDWQDKMGELGIDGDRRVQSRMKLSRSIELEGEIRRWWTFDGPLLIFSFLTLHTH